MVNMDSVTSQPHGINSMFLQHGSFDLETAIANLLHDVGCNSLELPSGLSADERNQAKVVASKHAELKCESYGFGSDRRLHIFKKSATTRVRVKNTFVEGCEASDGDANFDAIIFRSEPGSLWTRSPLCSLGNAGDLNLELPPLCLKASPTASPLSLPAEPDDRPEACGVSMLFQVPYHSPPTSPSGQSERREGSPTSSATETSSISTLPQLPYRSIPATPSGQAEAPAFPPGVFETFPVGMLVVIQGLVRAPAFNGRVGVVQSLDSETGRYDVLLGPQTSGQQRAKVKYENLRPACSTQNSKSSAAAA
jgi:hypothetical protein